jgi:hypothetical protein
MARITPAWKRQRCPHESTNGVPQVVPTWSIGVPQVVPTWVVRRSAPSCFDAGLQPRRLNHIPPAFENAGHPACGYRLRGYHNAAHTSPQTGCPRVVPTCPHESANGVPQVVPTWVVRRSAPSCFDAGLQPGRLNHIPPAFEKRGAPHVRISAAWIPQRCPHESANGVPQVVPTCPHESANGVPQVVPTWVVRRSAPSCFDAGLQPRRLNHVPPAFENAGHPALTMEIPRLKTRRTPRWQWRFHV